MALDGSSAEVLCAVVGGAYSFAGNVFATFPSLLSPRTEAFDLLSLPFVVGIPPLVAMEAFVTFCAEVNIARACVSSFAAIDVEPVFVLRVVSAVTFRDEHDISDFSTTEIECVDWVGGLLGLLRG